MSELKQTNQFAEALSSIPGIVDKYLASKMKDAVNVAVQLKSNKLREEAQAENEKFLKQIDSNIKAIIKDQVKAKVSKIMPKVEKYVTESLGAEVLARSSNQLQTSYVAATSLLEFELKKILIDKIEENKSINKSDIQKNLYNTLIESYNSDKDLFASYAKEDQAKSAQAEEHGPRVDDLEEPLHQEFNTGNGDVSPTVDDRPPQSWMTQLAQASGTQSSFNEFLATPIDFSAFIMNRLKLNNLTQDVLTGPTYDLIKGMCKSVVELEYHLEEVFKATNDQLDWHNPKGRPYPHDLSKPLPLIQNARGRQGTYHWGPKRQRFYGYATNMETSKDLYSRHRIIVVTSLKIMEFFGYKHLEAITFRRQDDQLYRFREGNFKRLRRQDIEDMLLLLVQGKLTNLNLDELFELNVALRMYTRRIVIQERIEDLQLAVESYQKKINL
ncbi:hypothetical protein Tco_0997243 [Tanacetum coccineum]